MGQITSTTKAPRQRSSTSPEVASEDHSLGSHSRSHLSSHPSPPTSTQPHPLTTTTSTGTTTATMEDNPQRAGASLSFAPGGMLVDALMNDSDFTRIQQFVTDRLNTNDGSADVNTTVPEAELNRLLSATARVFAKFPTEERALVAATKTISLCHKSLPSVAPVSVTELQMHALEAFSQINLLTKPDLIQLAWQFTVILWSTYPTTLPAACNIKHLACVVNAALEQEIDGQSRKSEAFEAGQEFVTYLMRVLSDSQLNALESEGVYLKLGLLIALYDEMPVDTLKQVIIGIGMFSEIDGASMSFIDESLSSSLLFAAQKHHSHQVLQQLIWRLFILFCQRDQSFCKSLLSMDLLGAIAVLFEQEGSYFIPVLEFLHDCCRGIGGSFISACLDKSELMKQLCLKLKVDNEDDGDAAKTAKLDMIALVCDFLALLCSKCDPGMVAQIMEHDCVSALEKCARKWPESCMLPACIAIEGVVNRFPPDIGNLLSSKVRNSELFQKLVAKKKEFALQDHHLFIQDVLSNPLVYTNPTLTELVYVTFQKLLKISTQESLARMCTSEFLELYIISFIRDTSSFPSQANRISFTTHYFVFQMKSKEMIELLKKNNFHTAISELVSSAENFDLLVAAMGLLACLISKYYEYLKDVWPFLESKVPSILITKAKTMGSMDNSHFGEDFSRILLNMTADKELSLELYNQGFLDQLIEQLDKNYLPVVTRSVIHAIGNIALGGQHIKQVLLDRKVYENLLQILSTKVEKGDAFLLSACCRVLHILASGDWAKRKFVEQGSVAILLKMLNLRKENPEVCWRPLGLLSSLGFMSVMNRRFILTPEVVETVARILKESANGKVISYTTLVFLGSGELDDGSVKLRKMEVGKYLQQAMDKPQYRKQAPDLERWGVHVLEKLNLHTVSVPHGLFQLPSPLKHSISDWPPLVDTTSPPLDGASNSIGTANSPVLMLPLEEAYFAPNHPTAEKLSEAALEQLAKLGLNPNKPLFRIGRIYGSTHGLCTNCEKDGISEELVIRPQSMTPQQYQHLIDNGWYRRGGVKMFRLRHNHNMVCCDWETRVKVNEFDHRTHKSYKKVLRKMPGKERLTVETKPTHFCREAFDLYNDYHVQRHDKPHKSEYSYCEHIVNSPIANQTIDGVSYGTFHQLYRLDGKLVAIGVIDVVPKGIVSIYMWYDVSKDISKLSFGVYSALKEIEMVQNMSKENPSVQYYYLQGWNGNNKKLSYKANYTPEDFYCPCIVQNWVPTLDGVSNAKEKLKASKNPPNDDQPSQAVNEDPTMDKTSEEAKSGDKPSSKEAKKPTESTDGGEEATEKKAKTQGGVNHIEDSKQKDDKAKESSSVSSDPPIACDAFPNDLERYRKATGRDSVDISKIVVCLNHSEYMHLSELFKCASMDSGQHDIMEKRLSELVAALGPELSSQLVLDLKACECEGTVASIGKRETSDSESLQIDMIA